MSRHRAWRRWLRWRLVCAALLAAGAGAATADAAPLPTAPKLYGRLAPADGAFLRLAHGWHIRMDARWAAIGRCETKLCAGDRLTSYARIAGDGAQRVRMALRFGAGRYGPPTSPCIRQVGAQVAYIGTLAWRLDAATYQGLAQTRAAVRAHTAALSRLASTAKRCQRSTSLSRQAGVA